MPTFASVRGIGLIVVVCIGLAACGDDGNESQTAKAGGPISTAPSTPASKPKSGDWTTDPGCSVTGTGMARSACDDMVRDKHGKIYEDAVKDEPVSSPASGDGSKAPPTKEDKDPPGPHVKNPN